jgi:hypothetical protein
MEMLIYFRCSDLDHPDEAKNISKADGVIYMFSLCDESSYHRAVELKDIISNRMSRKGVPGAFVGSMKDKKSKTKKALAKEVSSAAEKFHFQFHTVNSTSYFGARGSKYLKTRNIVDAIGL